MIRMEFGATESALSAFEEKRSEFIVIDPMSLKKLKYSLVSSQMNNQANIGVHMTQAKLEKTLFCRYQAKESAA